MKEHQLVQYLESKEVVIANDPALAGEGGNLVLGLLRPSHQVRGPRNDLKQIFSCGRSRLGKGK